MKATEIVIIGVVAAALVGATGCGKEEKAKTDTSKRPAAEGKKEKVESLKKEVERLKAEIAELQRKAQAAETELQEARAPQGK